LDGHNLTFGCENGNMNKNNGTLYSKGLYSSFCHIPKFDTLFDAGEGCATILGNELANVTRIMLSHGHADHSYKIDAPTKISNCEKVVMDCTFLNKNDRTSMTHFTLDEAIDICSNVGVKTMYASHLSPRYSNIPHNRNVGNMYVIIVDPTNPVIL